MPGKRILFFFKVL